MVFIYGTRFPYCSLLQADIFVCFQVVPFLMYSHNLLHIFKLTLISTLVGLCNFSSQQMMRDQLYCLTSNVSLS
jgi:hypothetical protein